jgi:hypothetical protein
MKWLLFVPNQQQQQFRAAAAPASCCCCRHGGQPVYQYQMLGDTRHAKVYLPVLQRRRHASLDLSKEFTWNHGSLLLL